jgi:putative ABC transport system permease protein
VFWRILKQLFRASRGRLAIALLAIISGAAVTTALLNLQWDASRKLSAEFRTLGANVLVLPQANGLPSAPSSQGKSGISDISAAPLISESVISRIDALSANARATIAPYLYIVATTPKIKDTQQLIVAGTWLDETPKMAPWWKISGEAVTSRDDLNHCLIGANVAKELSLAPGSQLELRYLDRSANFTVSGVIRSGGDEDSQVFANLAAVQNLANLQGRIGLIQVSVPGTPDEISAYMRTLGAAVPDLDVRPVRQLAEAEGQLLGRLRGLILAMVILILVLTALCVLASMAALAMERRRDVGLMKAIGGSMSRIVSIFLTEAGTLGLAGALAGYGLGLLLSRWIGRRAFDVSIAARPEVLPLVIALMIGVALAGAFPLRLLGRVRPAEILRGE